MCKYEKRNLNGGHEPRRLLAQLHYWLLKHTADFAFNIEIFTSVFARKHYKQMVAFIQTKSWELY